MISRVCDSRWNVAFSKHYLLGRLLLDQGHIMSLEVTTTGTKLYSTFVPVDPSVIMKHGPGGREPVLVVIEDW